MKKDFSPCRTVYPMPSILPPPDHPRVYIRLNDIQRIKNNLSKPENAVSFAAYEDNLKKPTQDIGTENNNYNGDVLAVIESRA